MEVRLEPAVAAHPDDIEFVMAGTLIQLGARRAMRSHYMNIANGCWVASNGVW